MTAALLAVLLAVAPPDTTLAALYGTWASERDTTFVVEPAGDEPLQATVFYEAIDLAEGLLTRTTVSTYDGPESDGHIEASQSRNDFRAVGLRLHFSDRLEAHLHPDGNRLRVVWSVADSTLGDVVYERAPLVPDAFLGDWMVTAIDDAGVSVTLPVRFEPDGTARGFGSDGDAVPVVVAEGVLFIGRDAWMEVADGYAVRSFTAYPYRLVGGRIEMKEGERSLWLDRR